MGNRTRIRFRYDGDLWSVVDQWADENGYREKDGTGDRRTYQKGKGFLVAPMMLTIESKDSAIAIEAWVRINLYVRMMAFFMLPGEISIESGGFRAVLPRNIAREAVNRLLRQLGQPPIR